MDKVGLIVITAVGSDLRPVKFSAVAECLQDLLKATHAAKEFGR